MKYIVGLGNIGSDYKKTRHNAGFIFLDYLADELNLSFSLNKKIKVAIAKSSHQLIFCKPQTYMNLSGQAVRSMIDYFDEAPVQSEMQNLIVVHDDLDITLGSYKIQFGVGPKKHNGLLSLYQHLGTDQFWHVRIGIENRDDLVSRIPGIDYVLQSFPDGELKVIQQLLPTIWQNIFSATVETEA